MSAISMRLMWLYSLPADTSVGKLRCTVRTSRRGDRVLGEDALLIYDLA